MLDERNPSWVLIGLFINGPALGYALIRINTVIAFLVYAICFHETVYDHNWCLHKSVGQKENGLELGFVSYWLNSI